MEAVLQEIGPTKLLKESFFCRLCGEENQSGINIFNGEDTSAEISVLINKYLPVKVNQDDDFPKRICPGCHIQLEATKLFMDLIIDGQAHLRELFKIQTGHLQREEQQRQKLEEALKAHNPNTSVETYTIQTDDSGEKYIIQIFSDGPLFPPEHELVLKADGLEKPKRKRGRPPKPFVDSNTNTEKITEEQVPEQTTKEELLEPDNDADGRRRRKIRAPHRYEGVVHGEEMDKMLKNEGVIDDDEVDECAQSTKGNNGTEDNNLIGALVPGTGDHPEPIFHRRPKMKSRVRKHGLVKRHKWFVCNVCKKEFLHLGTYEQHVKSHRVQYRCKHEGCAERSEKLHLLQTHQLEAGHEGISAFEDAKSAGGNLELPISPTQVTNLTPVETALESHEKSGEKREVICELCNKTFSCKQNYQVHYRAIHENDRPYKCDSCNMSFRYANSLKFHAMKHMKEGDTKNGLKYKCDKCDKIFRHPSSLCYHRDTEHSGGRRFVCSKCNKTFKHRQLLLRHQLVHSEDRPFQCTQCFQTYKTKANLLNHQTVHTGVRKFVCLKCGQCFAHRTSLSLHQRWHDGYKPFECDVCHKSFTQKGNLAEHKRIHTGEKPYHCDHCDKSFTTSSQYKLHIKRHSGEKPWLCEFCSKTFLHRDTWKTHVRRHMNDRPFKCKFCTRAFTESWALRRHERLHSGEKPYKCEECGKCFADSSNISKHRKVHKANAEKTVFEASQVTEKDANSELLEQINENVEGDSTNFISILDPSLSVKKDQIADNPLELRQVLDPDGNPISFTTPEGQPISIVSSGDNQKIQGLMPDGSLISIDLEQELDTSEKTAIAESNQSDVLSGIHFLTNNGIVSDVDVDKVGDKLENIQFLTDDGKVCFITYDESELLTLM